MRLVRIPLLAACLTLSAFASVVSSVRGVIHDPQHRPVPDAMVMLKAKSSDWSTTANADANGNFTFNAVPLGEYVVTVVGVGFEPTQQDVAVTSSAQPVLHFALSVAGAKEMINASATPDAAPTHDQRNTLNVGGDVTLPWRGYASTNVYYGSGFTNACPGQPYPGNYLPPHTTVDLPWVRTSASASPPPSAR